MIARTRLVPAVLGLALTGRCSPAPRATASAAREAQAPTAGRAGIGDPYFPQDGNGGIDVLHYDVHDSYAFGSGRLSGKTKLDLRATQELSRFDLDFLLPVRSVKVDGRRATFQQTGDHELRIAPAAPIATGQQVRVVVKYAGVPATESSGGESNWLAERHRGRRDERAAHGGLVVPGQRPPAGQGDLRHLGSPCPRART